MNARPVGRANGDLRKLPRGGVARNWNPSQPAQGRLNDEGVTA